MSAHTYGTARLARDDGAVAEWELSLEPHVTMRLKRVFGRIGRYASGKLRVTACPETCRDLLWVMSRYPLEVSDGDMELLVSGAEEHARCSALMRDVLSGRVEPRPFELALPLRRYQAEAAEASLQRTGLIVADDVGLGKSAIGIAIVASSPERRPALVVTLTHLTTQWQREFAKFVPRLRTHVAKKGTPYPLGEPRQRSPEGQAALFDDSPEIVILNYAKLAGWAGALAGKVRTVVFDECQELRRTGSNKYVAAQVLSRAASFRLGLSATPIYNYGGEFHSIMECIRPDALGSWEEFNHEWCAGSTQRDKTIVKDPRAFGSYLRDEGLMLRRTREDVGRELPAVSVVPHHVDSDVAQMLKGDGAIAELCRLVLGGGALERGEAMRAAGEFDYRLRQATGLAKAPYVARFVDLLLESGERVVLYGWHHAVYDVWREELARWEPVFFTGQESGSQKEQAKDAFVEGRSQLLCMSLRAGAGLDGLQDVCATVIFGELDWSPQVHTQCIGRVHRDGQRRPVVAYYLLADEGSDPVVADVLGIKRAQSEPVLDPNAPLAQPKATLDRVRLLAADYASRHGLKLDDGRKDA